MAGVISFLLPGRLVSSYLPRPGEWGKGWQLALLGRLSRPLMLGLEQFLFTWRQSKKLRQLNVMVKT